MLGKYFYYLFRYSRDTIEKYGSGTTFTDVSCAVMRQAPVSVLPGMEEQRFAGC